MRDLSHLVGAAVATAMIAVASLAQQTSTATAPAKSVCWDADRKLFPIDTTEKGSDTDVGLADPESTRKASNCGSAAATTRASFASSINLRAVRRPTALLNFEVPTEKPKSEDGNMLATESLQDQGPTAANEAQELAKKLSNPVASLISFPLQSNFDFKMGTGSGWRYTLNVQPVIPVKLNENWNMISRTIVPIIHQGNVTGPNQSQSGLGDITQSLFFSPTKTEPLVWAVGPVFLLPTATDAALGSQKWGLGPTALALKQKHGWTYGMLANHVWSVAGKSNRADVNATFLQPFLAFTNKQAWTYNVNTESTYDWNGHAWSVPINLSISKLVRFGKQPVSFGGGPKCWVTTPTGGAEGCGVRIVVTALFPK